MPPTRKQAGILAWAVRGCLERQEKGLAIPNSIEASDQRLSGGNGPDRRFLEEMCDRDPDALEDAGYLWGRFKDWMQNVNAEPISQQALGLRLRKEGFISVRGTGGRRRWKGVGLPGWPTRWQLPKE